MSDVENPAASNHCFQPTPSITFLQGGRHKAHDSKLQRKLAIKVLLAKQEEEPASRLLQEAQAASALDHPNICTIYEIDETPEGQMFIAMGYGVSGIG